MAMNVAEEEAAAAAIAERLNNPQVAQSLASLLDHVELLALLVGGIDSLLSRSEVIGDSLVEGIEEIRSSSNAEGAERVDLTAVVDSGRQLAVALPKATPGIVNALESGALDRVLSSEVMSPQALSQVELLARGLAKGSATHAVNPVAVPGVLSLVRLLKDPDINRAISYFATVAKSIGQELAAQPK